MQAGRPPPLSAECSECATGCVCPTLSVSTTTTSTTITTTTTTTRPPRRLQTATRWPGWSPAVGPAGLVAAVRGGGGGGTPRLRPRLRSLGNLLAATPALCRHLLAARREDSRLECAARARGGGRHESGPASAVGSAAQTPWDDRHASCEVWRFARREAPTAGISVHARTVAGRLSAPTAERSPNASKLPYLTLIGLEFIRNRTQSPQESIGLNPRNKFMHGD
jgi:hypothetical protein